MSTIDINKLEKLSALRIHTQDREKITNQLENIVDFIAQLQEVDTDGVAPMTSTVNATSTPEREDEVTAKDNRDALLKTAPNAEHGFFVVPRVVGES